MSRNHHRPIPILFQVIAVLRARFTLEDRRFRFPMERPRRRSRCPIERRRLPARFTTDGPRHRSRFPIDGCPHPHLRSFRPFALLLPVVLLSACTEYTIETTVNPDGTGLRVERMEVGQNPDVNVAPESFQALMHTSGAEGWRHSETTDEDGDLVHVFHRRTPVEGLRDWSGLGDRIRISGAVPSAAETTRGYVRLGDVRFHNDLHLRMAADSEGSTTFTFRETFLWERAADALVEVVLSDLDGALAHRFPNLGVTERGEVVGFARARLWTAVEEGLLAEGAEEDRLMDEVVQRTAIQGIKLIRVRHPEATEEQLEQILEETLVENDDRLVAFLEEELPGLNLALNSEVVFRLQLPGRVLRSNAHTREDGTLIWKFGPADAIHAPVEIFAESRVGGRKEG